PWLESIAAKSGRPVMIAAMFVDPGDPTRVFRELSEIEAARARGRELWAQVGCFPLGMEFTLRHPYPLEAFLAWRPAILAGDDEAAYRRVLGDPSFRTSLKEEAATPGVPSTARWSVAPSASSPRSPAATRGTSSSTSASTASWTRCSTASSSTP